MNNPSASDWLRFHRAYVKLRLQLDEELGLHHGIDADGFALLHALADADAGSMRLDRLATELGAARSTMLRRLQPLEKIGLVAFEGGVAERRVAVRAAGRRLIKSALETVGDVMGDVSAQLPWMHDGSRLSGFVIEAAPMHASSSSADRP
jgi:DNA-binding MarR family transcriptional regulator